MEIMNDPEMSYGSFASFSNPELLFQQLVHSSRIGFAAGGLHDLANEPAEHGGLGLDLLDFIRVCGQDLVDNLFDGSEIGNLLEPALFDNLGRITAFRPNDVEHVLGDFARD